MLEDPVEVRPLIPSIPEAAAAVAAEHRNVDLRSYPGVGHVPHLVEPLRFHRELLACLGGKHPRS